MMVCRICMNSENNRAYKIREMMFGFRDEFTYFECSSCGCLQIEEIPSNVAKYYPSGYYSFQKASAESAVRRFLRISRDRYAVFGSGLMGKTLSKRYPSAVLEILGAVRPDRDARILDVGCGWGGFLHTLQDLGFRRLVGADPYIAGDSETASIRIFKKTILEFQDSEKFDFIFFNHSLEHIWGQIETLSKVGRLLTPRGVCIVRMPVKTEAIWSLYGTDWVQIDAPRHFHIHTVNSFSHLIRECRLMVKGVTFDSSEFQFWGSEQYKRNIPLEAEGSYYVNPRKSILKANQIDEFRRKARELNSIEQGDQAAFSLVIEP